MKKTILKPEKVQSGSISLTLIFTFVIFLFLVAALLIVIGLVYVFVRFGILKSFVSPLPEVGPSVVFLLITSVLIGSLVTFAINRLPLMPFDKIIKQINNLAAGNYSSRLHFGKPISKIPSVRALEESFNTLADELQSTEMLRTDFVNNFSHEFKTPIVSISGFAKLLKKGNLSEEQRIEYLSIIEEETARLSRMATNILDLTKIENQAILTDVTTFNLSEQIRGAVLLLEDKWIRKNIELELSFEEFTISANEELLKQVWINLLDNAIKFSPEYGVVKIEIVQTFNMVNVTFSNNGAPIDSSSANKIFNKFYQADESHSSEGNGIGLAIVKSVISLHNGSVWVESDESVTSFTVSLPLKR